MALDRLSASDRDAVLDLMQRINMTPVGIVPAVGGDQCTPPPVRRVA